MDSTVTVEVNLPQGRVAELFADPRHTTGWMHDVDRIEVVSGDLGKPGSKYRIVPKKGNRVFVATVLARDIPSESRLHLDAAQVGVAITVTFQPLTANKTLLASHETFTFKGAFNAIVGLFARPAIRKAHRRHIEAFKTFAETHG